MKENEKEKVQAEEISAVELREEDMEAVSGGWHKGNCDICGTYAKLMYTALGHLNVCKNCWNSDDPEIKKYLDAGVN